MAHATDNTDDKQDESASSRQKNSQLADDILDKGRDVPIELKQPFLLPAWYDERKFRRGQAFFQYNFFAVMVSNLIGLVLVIVIPTILRVLVMTGQSSSPLTAFHRYLDTICHMLEWYDGDLRDPNSRACKSLMTIRGRHSYASKKATKAGYSHISQRDLSLAQFGFVGFALLKPKELGIRGNDKDFEGFIHFWRVVGHLLGIKDQYNLCSGDLLTTKETCQAMLDQVFTVLLKDPPPEFDYMANVMLEGMWAVNPTINPEATLAFTKYLSNIEYTPDSLYSRIIFNIQVFVHSTLLNSIFAFIFRPILNFNMWLSVLLAQKIPFLAFFVFGRGAYFPPHHAIDTSLPVNEQSSLVK